jgi:hypothetical protein
LSVQDDRIMLYTRKGGIMRTIDELVNEMYMDNEAHLEYMENMNGGDCDCGIHTTLNTIVKYWWDEEK